MKTCIGIACLFVCALASSVATAQCGGNKRQIVISDINLNLVAGDVWNGGNNDGVIARGGICGGCTIVNYPGGAYNNPGYPLTVTAYWGDGLSSPLTIRQSDGALLGQHTYQKPVSPGSRIKVTMKGQCVDIGSNWPEVMSNECDGTIRDTPWPGTSLCNPAPANVTVFEEIPPSVLVEAITPVQKGKYNKGALALFMDKAAPASGMRMLLSAPGNPRVKFGIPQAAYVAALKDSGLPEGMYVTPTNPAVITIPAGSYGINIDVDATAITTAVSVLATVQNTNDVGPVPPPVVKSVKIPIQ